MEKDATIQTKGERVGVPTFEKLERGKRDAGETRDRTICAEKPPRIADRALRPEA